MYITLITFSALFSQTLAFSTVLQKITFHNRSSHWRLSSNILRQRREVRGSSRRRRWRHISGGIHRSLANQRPATSALVQQLLAWIGWGKNRGVDGRMTGEWIWCWTIDYAVYGRSQTRSGGGGVSGVVTGSVHDDTRSFIHWYHFTYISTPGSTLKLLNANLEFFS